MTLDDLADQWLRLCNRTGMIVSILSEPMFTRVLQSFGIASILGAGVFIGASPAKAISYSFTSTGSFTCGVAPSSSGTCNLSFNDFTADWDGADWTFDQSSFINNVTISRSGGGSFSINTFSGSIENFGRSGQDIKISDGSNDVYFALSAAPATSGPFLATISDIQVVSTTNSLSTVGSVGITGSPQVYAAPYFASAISILPILTSFKRIKRRVLSV